MTDSSCGTSQASPHPDCRSTPVAKLVVRNLTTILKFSKRGLFFHVFFRIYLKPSVSYGKLPSSQITNIGTTVTENDGSIVAESTRSARFFQLTLERTECLHEANSVRREIAAPPRRRNLVEISVRDCGFVLRR